MSSIFSGGPESESKRPNYTRPGGDLLGQGRYPFGLNAQQTGQLPGFIGDTTAQQMYPVSQIFGNLGNLPGAAQQGGDYFRQLATQGIGQGFLTAQNLAGMAPLYSAQQQGFLSYLPQAYQQSQGYQNQLAQLFGGGQMAGGSGWGAPQMGGGAMGPGGMPQMGGGPRGPLTGGGLNSSGQGFGDAIAAMIQRGRQQGGGAMGPGGMPQMGGGGNGLGYTSLVPQGGGIPGGSTGRVTDAALGQLGNTGIDGDLFHRASALLRPEVRQAFSARGMGTSGQAIQGESDAQQRLADSFAQRAMAERIGLLGTAANAAGAEGSERVGLTNAGINQRLGLTGAGIQERLGLGNLALGGMQGVPGAFNQFAQAPNIGLQGLGLAGQQQFSPLQLAGLGAGVYGQGLGMPIELAQQLYNSTRAPLFQFGNWVNGVPNVANSGQSEGFLGIG